MKDFFVVAEDIRSTHNVGAIFRTGDGAGVSHIYLCGITPRPPRQDIHKVALGADETMPWTYRKNAVVLLKSLRKKGIRIIALENNIRGAKEYQSVRYTAPLAIVVGSEVGGLSKDILRLAHDIVFLPMRGKKESLNVSVAFGILAYHIASEVY